jgi:hypothetical protein
MVFPHRAICDGFLVEYSYEIIVGDSRYQAFPVEREDNWLLVPESLRPCRMIWISDHMKNPVQLRIGLITEILCDTVGSSSAGPHFCSSVEMLHSVAHAALPLNMGPTVSRAASAPVGGSVGYVLVPIHPQIH